MEPESFCATDPPIPKPPCDCSQDGCTKVGYQYVDVSVPIQLKPHTTLDNVEIKCCGEPTIMCRENGCGNTLELTITQRVSVKLPLRYTITACISEAALDCACGGNMIGL